MIFANLRDIQHFFLWCSGINGQFMIYLSSIEVGSMQKFAYYFWTFVLGSFLGVVIESVWCAVRWGKLESRKGLIYGPFNPLYGVATVVLSFSINWVTNKEPGNIFLIGVVVASCIEYMCSYYQEKIVGTRSWNYDKFKFNLKGRINLLYSLAWGFLTLVWYRQCMPMVDEFVGVVANYDKLTLFAVIFMVYDCFISLMASIRRKERRQNIEPRNYFEKHLDVVYNDEVMDRVYPNAVFVED